MARANYRVVEKSSSHILLQDLGPWDRHPTITNDAEAIVDAFHYELGDRRLFYIDSEGRKDEILVDHRKRFVGFAPGETDLPRLQFVDLGSSSSHVCRRCRRLLKSPASIACGLGSVCARKAAEVQS